MPSRLPESLLKVALAEVGKATKYRVENVDEPTKGDDEQIVVLIDGTGEFSETKLKAMDYLGNMGNTCKQGMLSYPWRMNSIEPVVALIGAKSDCNADYKSEALKAAKEIYLA